MKPIIFNTDMVRAILDGKKTQARRALRLRSKKLREKGWPKQPIDIIPMPNPQNPNGREWVSLMIKGDKIEDNRGAVIKCFYGIAGDQLYVRERFAFHEHYDHLAPSKVPDFAEVQYFATDEETMLRGKWRPSIYMPEWASRITLEIKDIRVERVQDISNDDAEAEGLSPNCDHKYAEYNACTDCMNTGWAGPPREDFPQLWDSINLKRGYPWSENCWVWVVEFERIEK